IAAGNTPGSKDDPVVSQTYVDELVGVKVTALQNQIDEIMGMLEGTGGNSGGNTGGDSNSGGNSGGDTNSGGVTTKTVTVTGDSVNIRASASTSGSVVTTVSKGTVLTYLSQTQTSDEIWYNVKTSGGSTGWIRSDLVTSPK
ncbi:MAG: SH3 domain-containing protein, partial [Clostridia bacterium]|nr:SH3 domain-containing protein [Clostridia bacterium]